jgi:hypothetical protein
MLYNGILHPDFNEDLDNTYLSRREATKLQEALNPVHCEQILRNKILFYKTLALAHLPHPEVIAVFDKKTAGFDRLNNIITSKKQWMDFFDNSLPEEFVIKPAYGARGIGVKTLKKQNGLFCGLEQNFTSEQLYDFMNSYPACDGYIIQKKIYSHRNIVEFTGIKQLQTIRIVTLIDKNSQLKLLISSLKLITANVDVDNYRYGLIGNFYTFLDNNTGRIDRVVIIRRDGKPAVITHQHHLTKKSVDEFVMPFWPETIDLLKTASMIFLPVRTIGWDVAITDQGPLIVEGNIWWSQYNREKYAHIILDDLGYIPY